MSRSGFFLLSVSSMAAVEEEAAVFTPAASGARQTDTRIDFYLLIYLNLLKGYISVKYKDIDRCVDGWMDGWIDLIN